MKPLPQEQVQGTVQVLLSFLDSDGANVPGNMLEGVVSGKSLLRGLLGGSLILCQPGEAPKPIVEEVPAAGEAEPQEEAA